MNVTSRDDGASRTPPRRSGLTRNESEQFVQHFFAARFGLRAEKIPEGSTKTPDFKVFHSDELVFVAEVKLLTAADIPTFRVPGISPEEVPDHGEAWDDNGPIRVSRAIEKAVPQLRGCTEAKVLVLVNQETLMAFTEDFRAGFDGYDRIGAAMDGSRELSYLAPAALLQNLRDGRRVIDLYLWIETDVNEGERDVWFASTNEVGWKLGQRFFRSRVVRSSTLSTSP